MREDKGCVEHMLRTAHSTLSLLEMNFDYSHWFYMNFHDLQVNKLAVFFALPLKLHTSSLGSALFNSCVNSASVRCFAPNENIISRSTCLITCLSNRLVVPGSGRMLSLTSSGVPGAHCPRAGTRARSKRTQSSSP